MIMSNQWDQKARRRNQDPEDKISIVVLEWFQINFTYNSFYNVNVNLQKQLENILKVSGAALSRLTTGLGFCLKTGSDTFRSVLIYGKEQQPRKNIFVIVEKNFTFLRGFNRKNTFFGISRNLIRKGSFRMTLNARQSPADSL